jgi:hypothetical protein
MEENRAGHPAHSSARKPQTQPATLVLDIVDLQEDESRVSESVVFFRSTTSCTTTC